MPATHDMDCPDRPLLAGETFSEKWVTRKGEVGLEWEVTERADPTLWCAATHTDFTGPIRCRYSVEPLGPERCKYTRAIHNPARPKAPTEEMVARMDDEAELCLANIKRMTEERAENAAVVAQIRADGVAVLPLLTAQELEAARSDMDLMYRETYDFKDEEHDGERQLYDPPPETVGALPGVERVFSHPRITAILSEVMGEAPGRVPFLQAMRTDRYLGGHNGVTPHQDGGSQFALPFEKMATMIFRESQQHGLIASSDTHALPPTVDDIGEDSGALEYVPGSHLRQLLRPDGTAPHEEPLPGGRCPEIDESYARGDFKPVVLKAGSVVFRVPCVWHAVRPVHRLRRYVTGRYFVRAPAARIDGANGSVGFSKLELHRAEIDSGSAVATVVLSKSSRSAALPRRRRWRRACPRACERCSTRATCL